MAIANDFGKSHKHLLGKIDEINRPKNGPISTEIQDFFADNFIEGTYQDEKNRLQRMYYVKRDGCTKLILGFTGKKDDRWQIVYFKLFNKMEKQIQQISAGEFHDRLPQTFADALRAYADELDGQRRKTACHEACHAISCLYLLPK